MKHISLLTIGTVLFVAMLSAENAAAQTGSAADNAAIKANVAQMAHGWNTKSAEEFARPFAVDSDYVVINGHYIKGKAENIAGHAAIFRTIHKASTLAYDVEQIRYIRPDVAIVHVLATMTMPAGETSQKHNARISMTMARNKSKWEIASFHNTSIQPTEDNGGK